MGHSKLEDAAVEVWSGRRQEHRDKLLCIREGEGEGKDTEQYRRKLES